MSEIPVQGPPIVAPRLLYGLLAEFDTEEDILAAARAARAAGYRQLDAYTPFPVDGLATALGYHARLRINVILLGVLFAGAALGFGLQFYGAVLSYPLNVGGRPLNSWPAFLPITVETMILFGALATFFGMLLLNGLPASNRTLRNTPRFDLASRDRFFLCVESQDEQFDRETTRAFLESLHPVTISEVRR